MPLQKLERWQGRFWEQVLMPGRRLPEPSLLRTHPETTERVRRLLAFLPQSEPPRSVLAGWGEPGHGFADALADGRRRRAPRRRIGGLWY
jgi:heat shock protein HtpX